MGRNLWSTAILLMASAAAAYLAATHRTRPCCPPAVVAEIQPKPVVMLPSMESLAPAFLADPFEPIIMFPEPVEPALVANDGQFMPPSQLPKLGRITVRMPYADEEEIVGPPDNLREPNPLVPPVCPCGNEESAVWNALLDIVRQILDVTRSEEPVDPASETPQRDAQPVPGDNSAQPAPMPQAKDYHDKFPSCPYLNGGCPRSYSPFPAPAQQFDRPTPMPPE